MKLFWRADMLCTKAMHLKNEIVYKSQIINIKCILVTVLKKVLLSAVISSSVILCIWVVWNFLGTDLKINLELIKWHNLEIFNASEFSDFCSWCNHLTHYLDQLNTLLPMNNLISASPVSPQIKDIKLKLQIQKKIFLKGLHCINGGQ